jgi:hypothetical protein
MQEMMEENVTAVDVEVVIQVRKSTHQRTH